MTADDACAAGDGLGETDRDLPTPETGHFAQDNALLVGTVDAVAGLAGAPLVASVDMQLVEIAVAVAEFRSLRGAGVFGNIGIVAHEA